MLIFFKENSRKEIEDSKINLQEPLENFLKDILINEYEMVEIQLINRVENFTLNVQFYTLKEDIYITKILKRT